MDDRKTVHNWIYGTGFRHEKCSIRCNFPQDQKFDRNPTHVKKRLKVPVFHFFFLEARDVNGVNMNSEFCRGENNSLGHVDHATEFIFLFLFYTVILIISFSFSFSLSRLFFLAFSVFFTLPFSVFCFLFSVFCVMFLESYLFFSVYKNREV